MTLYRQISANQFPAVRIGARLVIPARYLDEMAEAALEHNIVVDASHWAPRNQETNPAWP